MNSNDSVDLLKIAMTLLPGAYEVSDSDLSKKITRKLKKKYIV